MNVGTLPAPAVSVKNPFPGLRPFQADESERFFGRDDDIFELLDRLRHMRFLAVVGASGCGKSSLIGAGLVASLSEGALPGNWRVAVLRPWQSPVAQLAAALGAGGALDVPASSREEATAIVKAILQRGSLGVVEALQRYPLPPDDRLLILIDQFEELFTFMRDPTISGAQDEARAFVKLLLEALCPKHGDLPVCVALTMRSDFLGYCALFPGLADAINNGLYLLPQMNRDQLRDAIRGPVEVCDGKISERLVDTLINDLKDDTDQLPVLQHAMMRLWGEWRRRGGEKIDFEDYRRVGEMNDSLGNHAEEVYASLDGPEHHETLDGPRQQIAEAVFRRITRVEEGKIVRRQTALGAIRKATNLRDVDPSEVISVIDEFRQDGRSFLVPPPPEALDDDTVIDISHESLIRQWGRLRKWAEGEARNREIHRQLTEAARIWAGREECDRDESFLFGGKRLLEADAWLKDNPGLLSEVENDFLAASQDAYERRLRERPKRDLSERVAAEGATQAAAIEKESAHVFLSYARRDRPFAERLRAAFAGAGQETLVDWDILPTQGSEAHVLTAIEAADTFVFVISPHSIESDRCRRELRHAISHNKRIVPVMLRSVEEWRLPDQLRESFWVRFTEKDDFDGSFRTLRDAINTDLYWVQAHSRLLVRATDWEKRGRDTNLLLRGHDLSEAEQWLGKEKLAPALTELQRQYIDASRVNSARRQKIKIVYMTTSLVVSLLLLAAAAVLAAIAYSQANEARKQTQEAEKQRGIAEQKGEEAQGQKDKAQEQALIVAQQAQEATRQAELARSEQQRAVQERARALNAMRQEQAARQYAFKQKTIAEQRLKNFQQIRDGFSAFVRLEFSEDENGRNNTRSAEKLMELAGLYSEQGDYKTAANIYGALLSEVSNDFESKEPGLAATYYEAYAQVLRYVGNNTRAARMEEAARRIQNALQNPPKK